MQTESMESLVCPQCGAHMVLRRTVKFPYRDAMRCPIHVDEIAEIFARVIMTDKPQHWVYNTGGQAISIGAIAEREGRSPLEVAYDLMLQRDGHELLYLPILGYANGGLWAIDEMLRHPATVLGLGDGGAHCGSLW